MIKTDHYEKPHIADFFSAGKAYGARRFPYPGSLSRQHDIFTRLILDGGAFFFTKEHIGDPTGAGFLRALDGGRLLAPWRQPDGEFDWDRAYDQTANIRDAKTGQLLVKPAMERHVWLNRLYFLLPIADDFFQSGDEQRARQWYGFFSDWIVAHPYDATKMPQGREGNRVWDDMQIAWRLLVMVHSVALLSKSTSLKKRQWKEIYRSIRQHAQQVYLEGRKELTEKTGRGNHFLQKGTALIYTGVLFPEFPESTDFINCGRQIIKYELAHEVRKDGSNIEDSPSYSHFIARLYLDAYLLLAKNGLEVPRGLKSGIVRQYRFLDRIMSPEGLTLQLSDSYALDAERDLAFVGRLFEFPRVSRRRSTTFNESGFSILRDRDIVLYIDATEPRMFHHHFGAPNLLAFLNSQPLLVDTGCCNYDWRMREDWCKSPLAHNSVVVSPTADFSDLAHYTRDTTRIEVRRHTAQTVELVHTTQSGEFRYVWRRRVVLNSDGFEVQDRIAASSRVFARQCFHFAPANVALGPQADSATIHAGENIVTLEQLSGSKRALRLDYYPALNEKNEMTSSACLTSQAEGKVILFRVRFQRTGG